MAGISDQRALVDALEEEGNILIGQLAQLAVTIRNTAYTAVALGEFFDTSLARLAIAGELDNDLTAVRLMRARIAEQLESSVSTIRAALDS